MSTYSADIEFVLRNKLIPKMQAVSMEIAAIEPYSYSGTDLLCLRREFDYLSMIYDFLYEYTLGTEELDNAKLVNIVRLIEIPESERKLSNSTLKIPIPTNRSGYKYTLYIDGIEYDGTSSLEGGTTVDITIVYTTSRTVHGVKRMEVSIGTIPVLNNYISGGFTYVTQGWYVVPYSGYLDILARASEDNSYLDTGSTWQIPVPGAIPVVPCAVFCITDSGIYSYEQATGVATYRFTSDILGPDIASSDTKIWISGDAGYIDEYDITLDPFTAVFNRSISYTLSMGSGLSSINNTTLVGAGMTNLISYDITTDVAVETVLFSLGHDRYVAGDIMYNSISDTYIVITMQDLTGNQFITEYSSTGVVLGEIDITDVCNSYGEGGAGAWGLFQYGDSIYVTLAYGSDSDVYEITPIGLVLATALSGLVVYGASQNVTCIDANLLAEAPLLDKDGNRYTTTIINNQEWIVENFKTTTYTDDAAIPNLTDNTEWEFGVNATKNTYGALYNWYAVTYSGPEQVSYWANVGYDTFSEIGLEVSCSSDGSSAQWATAVGANTFTYAPKLRIIIDIALGSGTMPNLTIGTPLGEIGGFTLVEGINTIDYDVSDVFNNPNAWEDGLTINYDLSNYIDINFPYATDFVATISTKVIVSIAPTGWHIPTISEIIELISYAGSNYVAGIHLKEAGTNNWEFDGGDNSTGFTALGSGFREFIGSFVYFKQNTIIAFIPAPEYLTGELTIWYGDTVTPEQGSNVNYYSRGYSVRPIKDDSTDPGTVIDIDGNVYTTVKIGTQVWMAENLKTERYTDGTIIPIITDDTLWTEDTAGAMCYYDNDTNVPSDAYCWYENFSYGYSIPYGALYNYLAVSSERGLAYLERAGVEEYGWRVASVTDYENLITYYGGNSVAGGPLKEDGEAHWQTPNTDATNLSGFTALPGGYRTSAGEFTAIQLIGEYTTPDIADPGDQASFRFEYDSAAVSNYNGGSANGLSVRLVRDLGN